MVVIIKTNMWDAKALFAVSAYTAGKKSSDDFAAD
jgi:hypothetical protein